MKKLIFLLSILFFTATGYFNTVCLGQCLDPIKKYIDESIRTAEPEKGQQYFMRFTIRSIPPKQSSMAPSTVESTIYRSKDRLIFETKDISIYQDEINAFVIVHPLKRIIWEKDREKIPEDRSLDMANFQKMILNESELEYCKKELINGNQETLKVKLRANEKMQDEMKVRNTFIDFNLAINQIAKVETLFVDGEQLERQIIEYQQIDYNHKGSKLKPAQSMVFNAKGELLPTLQNYTLIEN